MAHTYRHVPWQRNIRKIPAHVSDWLEQNPTVRCVVGCMKTIPISELGKYEHLGIGIVAAKLIYPESRIPIAQMGPYSTKNREGWETKRDDLPKITRTFTFDVPNWGDPSNGYHSVDQDREVYQRDYFDPPNFAIRISCLKESASAVIFNFVVDWPVDRRAVDFETDLLFALNLLQENVGACGVLPADADRVELLASVDMSWEFFPPGTAPEVALLRGPHQAHDPRTCRRHQRARAALLVLAARSLPSWHRRPQSLCRRPVRRQFRRLREHELRQRRVDPL